MSNFFLNWKREKGGKKKKIIKKSVSPYYYLFVIQVFGKNEEQIYCKMRVRDF
jgi:hypothetical protein